MLLSIAQIRVRRHGETNCMGLQMLKMKMSNLNQTSFCKQTWTTVYLVSNFYVSLTIKRRSREKEEEKKGKHKEED